MTAAVTCRTFIRGDGEIAPTVIEGHDPKLTEFVHAIRRMTRDADRYAALHYCERCGALIAVTAGDFTPVRAIEERLANDLHGHDAACGVWGARSCSCARAH